MLGPCVLAIDPGTVKCGIAVVNEVGVMPLFRRVVPLAHFEHEIVGLLTDFSPATILLGSGTASAGCFTILEALGVRTRIVDEYGTTLAARARYFAAFPPRGWRRLIPAGLRIPPVAIDDWAAVVMAERFLTEGVSKLKETDAKKIISQR